MVLPQIDQKRGPCLDCTHREPGATCTRFYRTVYRGCVNLVGQPVGR